MLDDAHRPLAFAERSGDLGWGEPFNEPENDHLLLVRAQAADRAFEGGPLAVCLGGGDRVASRRGVDEVGIEDAPRALGAEVVGEDICGDGVEPGRERSPAVLVAADGLPRPDEDMFGQVLALHLIANPETNVAEYPLDIGVVERAEGVGVTRPRSLQRLVEVDRSPLLLCHRAVQLLERTEALSVTFDHDGVAHESASVQHLWIDTGRRASIVEDGQQVVDRELRHAEAGCRLGAADVRQEDAVVELA